MSVKLIVTLVIDFKDVVLGTQRYPRFGAGITTVPTNSIEVGGLGVCFYFGKYLTANVRRTMVPRTKINVHVYRYVPAGQCKGECSLQGLYSLFLGPRYKKRISNPHNRIINSCRKRYVVKEV